MVIQSLLLSWASPYLVERPAKLLTRFPACSKRRVRKLGLPRICGRLPKGKFTTSLKLETCSNESQAESSENAFSK